MMDEKKRVLCFGDSNTWGWTPGSGQRLEADARWPDLLDTHLGDGVEVVADGVPGRTSAHDDPEEGVPCGVSTLARTLGEQAPLDLVIIMLGTNDLKDRFALSAEAIAEGIATLIAMVRANGPAQVLVVSPPPLAPVAGESGLFSRAVGTSRGLAEAFARVAREAGCGFVDAAAVVVSSPRDGVHWEPEAHRRFAAFLAAHLKSHDSLQCE